MRVLFMCTANSCRSILSEAMFNHLAPPGFQAISTGSFPRGQVLPRSLVTLQEAGIGIDGLSSKGNDAYEDNPPDIVITVCGSAAGEACPAYLGSVLRTHWGVEDPAHATGTDAEIDAVFMQAYTTLRHRIEAFFALPLSQLQNKPDQLKQAMDNIATII